MMLNIPGNIDNLLDHLSEGIYIVDRDRRITYWNRASERITGYTKEQVLGRFCQSNILRHVNDQGDLLCLNGCPLAATIIDGQVRDVDVFLNHAAGHRVPVSVRALPLIEEGQIIGAVELFSENVSLAQALAKITELQQVAMLDELSRVGNRRMAISRLAQAQHEWNEHHIPYAVLIADIDNFKIINDRYGHEVGDRTIQMIARSLSSGLRPFDFIGRWGGDEFIIVLNNLREDSLLPMVERLRMLVERSNISLEGYNDNQASEIKVTLSLGGAVILPGEDQDSLKNRADRLMYQSKLGGRNRVTV